MPSPKDKFKIRMFQWLATAMVLFAIAAITALSGIVELRPIGLIASKAANVTLGAFIGYWIDRHAFRSRIEPGSDPLLHLRRAMIIGAAIYAVAGG